jgi:hypothetical protein
MPLMRLSPLGAFGWVRKYIDNLAERSVDASIVIGRGRPLLTLTIPRLEGSLEQYGEGFLLFTRETGCFVRSKLSTILKIGRG